MFKVDEIGVNFLI